eukprot:6205611-Pleurochrysis_carterae.AAC.6
MPCKAIMHAQRSAGAIVTACFTGQTIFKCTKPVPRQNTAKCKVKHEAVEASLNHYGSHSPYPNGKYAKYQNGKAKHEAVEAAMHGGGYVCPTCRPSIV